LKTLLMPGDLGSTMKVLMETAWTHDERLIRFGVRQAMNLLRDLR
jgi:hypothetical protein